MSAVIEKVRAEKAEQDAVRQKAYAALVRKVANGEDNVSTAAVLTTVNDAGRDLDDLAADVARLRSRLDAVAMLNNQRQVDSERAARTSELKAVQGAQEEANRRFDDQKQKLKNLLADVAHRQLGIDTARQLLLRTADPDLVRQVDDLTRERWSLDKEIHESRLALRDLMKTAGQELPGDPVGYDHLQVAPTGDPTATKAKAMVRRHAEITKARATATQIRESLATAEVRLAEVVEEIAQTQAEMLVP